MADMSPYSVEAWPPAEESPPAEDEAQDSAPPAPGRPARRSTRRSTRRTARRLIVPVIVLGLLAAVAVAGVVAYKARQHAAAVSQFRAALARHNRALAREQNAAGQWRNALTRVGEAHGRLNDAMNTVVNGSHQCLTVSCFDTTAANAASGDNAFLHTIRGISFPAGVSPAVTQFERDVAASQQAWTYMAHATSFTDYGNRATRAEEPGRVFDSGYSALTKSLDRVGTALSEQTAMLNRESAALKRRAAVLNVPVNLRKLPEPPAQSLASNI